MKSLRYSGQTGSSRLGWLLFLLFVIASIFVGVQVVPFYYYYYEILGLIESQAQRADEYNDNQIRKKIMERIEQLELPIENSDALKINRYGGKIVIELSYAEVLYIEWGENYSYDIWVFEFNPRAERRYE